MSVQLTLKCRKHPSYQAKRAPRTKACADPCDTCEWIRDTVTPFDSYQSESVVKNLIVKRVD